MLPVMDECLGAYCQFLCNRWRCRHEVRRLAFAQIPRLHFRGNPCVSGPCARLCWICALAASGRTRKMLFITGQQLPCLSHVPPLRCIAQAPHPKYAAPSEFTFFLAGGHPGTVRDVGKGIPRNISEVERRKPLRSSWRRGAFRLELGCS
jgi:hypothetical protein